MVEMSPPETDPRRRPSSGKAVLCCAALVIYIGAALVPAGAARATAGHALSFATAKHYAIGTSPCSMTLGELNGDGKPDIVTANCDTTKVSVLLDRGDGSFEARRDYTVGHHPEHLDVADLNRDGKSDLLTANGDRTISVLLNEGAGTLGPSVTYDLGLGSHDSLSKILVADLNDDHEPDLVTETDNTSSSTTITTVSVLLNHGRGTFEPKRDYLSTLVEDLALADLNGDTKPDIVAASEQVVSVLLNGGDGSFEARRDYESFFPRWVAVGDLNGDGKPDLATTANGPGTTEVFLNRGDGSFERSTTYDSCVSCSSPSPDAIAIADINADDRADLVAEWDDERYLGIHEGSEYVTVVAVLLNKGGGRFASARSYEISHPGSDWLAVVDLNGDGKPDVAAVDEDSTLSVLLNKGVGRLEPSLYYRLGDDSHAYASDAVASADLNGDGRPDFAAALAGRRHRNTVAVRLNAPGVCNVQWVRGMIVASAKRRLARANCRVGKVTRVYRKNVAKGRVVSQKPRFGAVLPGGAKVNLVVSRGRKRS